MKKLFPLLVMLFLAAGAKSVAQSTISMKGAYSLIRQTGGSGGAGDTILKKDQFKIYTDKYMMYASPQSSDSFAIYGVGTYKINKGKVVEYVFRSSLGGNRKDTFELNVTKNDKGYTQIIEFPDSSGTGKYVMTEEYEDVGKPVTTPLDGAWVQQRNLQINKNGDTSVYQRTQYKVYQSGHFIWANTYPATESTQPISSFGYGTFQMVGNNASREVNSNSTFITDLVGVPINIQLEFTGKDSYKQTITNQNGDKSVEIYRRLK